jgi:hypothetical protein
VWKILPSSPFCAQAERSETQKFSTGQHQTTTEELERRG